MRIVLDTTILVRAVVSPGGPARQVLMEITERGHALVLSNEMLVELARVLRYPRMIARHGLTEERVYGFIGRLRSISQTVALDPLLMVPIRDLNDIIVAQTAILGEADILCTTDSDFYAATTLEFLGALGIVVTDDINLLARLRPSTM